ncbi:MAG: hypothetical protein EOP78_04855 [Variovorax sp.]|nr:MAG: hypothetical protein EOP78_04855 [Variovorax sp.]
MSRLDAIVFAAGSLGLAANLALSQPRPANGVPAGPSGKTLRTADKNAFEIRPIYDKAVQAFKTARR